MPRLGDDPDSWGWGPAYRLGYAAAADRLDAARFTNTSHGRAQARGGGLDAASIVNELARQIGRDAAGPSVEAIHEGVADALDGRRPRW